MKNIKMTQFLVFLVTASQAVAYNYYCGQPDSEERSLKWSTCNWGSEISMVSKNLPGKPGAGDSVCARPGFSLEIDADANVQGMSAGSGSELTSSGHNIKIRRSLDIGLSCSNDGRTNVEFKKCSVESTGIKYSYWALAKQAGMGILRLEDSVFIVKGNLTSAIPHNPSTSELEGTAGCAVSLIGNSKLEISGGVVIDPIIKNQPNKWKFCFDFKSKDGKLPILKIGKRFNTSICDVSITLDDKIAKGRYTLTDIHDRKTNLGDVRKFTVNGEEYKLGAPIKIGLFTGRITLGKPTIASVKDRSTPNELILSVKLEK